MAATDGNSPQVKSKKQTRDAGASKNKKRTTVPLNFDGRSSNAIAAANLATAKEFGHKRKRHATSGDSAEKKKPAVKRMRKGQGSSAVGKTAEPKKNLKENKNEEKEKQDDKADATVDTRPITSYAIATANTVRNRCAECNKGIPVGALYFSKLERAGRHVKKRDAIGTNWHQNCFIMPAALVKFPVECLRGWTQLAEKQQRRVRALFAAGEGATMRKVTEEMQREKAAIAAAKEVKLTTTSSDLVTKNHSQLSSTLAKTAGDENINDANERQHIRF